MIAENITNAIKDDRIEEIPEMVIEALRQFYIHDLALLQNPYEPTISAKLGMYLHDLLTRRKEFKSYHVDCEYNRAAMGAKIPPKGYSHKTMRPDILIHRRVPKGGNAFNTNFNLLFCEVKIEDISQNDIEKINHAIVKYHYHWGLSIHNIATSGVDLCWVKNGQRADDIKLDQSYSWDVNNKTLKSQS